MTTGHLHSYLDTLSLFAPESLFAPARFFGMARPGRLRLGPEIVPHDAMHRRIAKFYVLLLTKPLLDLFVAPEPLWLRKAPLELLHHAGRDRLLAGPGRALQSREASPGRPPRRAPANRQSCCGERQDGEPPHSGSSPLQMPAEAACGNGAESGRLFPCEPAAPAFRPARKSWEGCTWQEVVFRPCSSPFLNRRTCIVIRSTWYNNHLATDHRRSGRSSFRSDSGTTCTVRNASECETLYIDSHCPLEGPSGHFNHVVGASGVDCGLNLGKGFACVGVFDLCQGWTSGPEDWEGEEHKKRKYRSFHGDAGSVWRGQQMRGYGTNGCAMCNATTARSTCDSK